MTHPSTQPRQPVLHNCIFMLTVAQIEYLARATGEEPEGTATQDVIITQYDDEGGIFVVNASDAGDEGAGVWVDAAGHEHVEPNPNWTGLTPLQEVQLVQERKAGIEYA